MVERCFEAARDDFPKFAQVVRDSASGAAEREAGADDERPCADRVRDGASLIERVRASGLRHVEAEFFHRGLEEVPVFGARNRIGFRADEFHAVSLEDLRLVELHGEVEGGLPA